MKKIRWFFSVFILASVLIGSLLFMIKDIYKEPPEKKEVYLVVKTVGDSLDFWETIKNGATVAATELGAQVIMRGPTEETKVKEQIEVMEDILEKKPEAIAIAATDYNALTEVCEKAIAQGITLVTFDSDVHLNIEHSYIGTNNINAAKRLAHEIGVQMQGEGEVGIVAHVKGALTATQRTDGFIKGLHHFEKIRVVGEVYYTDGIRYNAYLAAKNMMEANPELKAIYGTNEVCILGIADAVKEHNRKDLIIGGFDLSSEIAEMIELEYIDVVMVQRAFNMGYIAIREALEVADGKEPETIDTGAVMINKENMFLKENQKLIVPN